jgi:hypothetical protein
MSNLSGKTFEEFIGEHLSWLVADYGFAREPVSGSPEMVERVIRYGSADYIVLMVRDLFEVACILIFKTDEETHFPLGLITSFIEHDYHADDYSGTEEQQVERFTQILKQYAPQLFGSDFLKMHEKELNEFAPTWYSHFRPRDLRQI